MAYVKAIGTEEDYDAALVRVDELMDAEPDSAPARQRPPGDRLDLAV